MSNTLHTQEVAASLDAFNRMPIDRSLYYGLYSGKGESPRFGQGGRRARVREYEPGDPVETIDLLASFADPTGATFVCEERNRVAPKVLVVSDALSPRYALAEGVGHKQEVSAGSALALLSLGMRSRMSSGAVFSGANGILEMPYSTNTDILPMHLEAISEHSRHEVDEATVAVTRKGVLGREKVVGTRYEFDDSAALKKAAEAAIGGLLLPKSLVFVVSDFRGAARADDIETGWADALAEIADLARTIAVRIDSPADTSAPQTSAVQVGNRRISTDTLVDFDRAYQSAADERGRSISSTLASLGIPEIRISTQEKAIGKRIIGALEDIAKQRT